MITTTTCAYTNPLYWNSQTFTLTAPDNTTNFDITYNFASSTCTTETASTTQQYYNGFSYGEIINSLFNFLTFAVVLYFLFTFITYGIKIRTKKNG